MMDNESADIHKRRGGIKGAESPDARLAGSPPSTVNTTGVGKLDDEERAKLTVLDIARVVLGVFILVNGVLSYALTRSFSWGLKGTRYFDVHYWQHQLRPSIIFSDEQLACFNGTDGSRIYLAIEGDVYDVTNNRKMYGPGAPYALFAGRDASRVFASGCFEPSQLTHDLRGLDFDSARPQLDRWHRFFQSSNKYWQIGTVVHPDESGDPPPVCSGSPKP